MSVRKLLPPESISTEALAAISTFHPDIVQEVATTVQRDAVVVVGMQMNPVVKAARKALAEAGIAYTYLEYGSYLTGWKPRLAIKLWSGWPTYPQVFVRGMLVGGNLEMRKALTDGTLRQRLAGPTSTNRSVSE